MLLNQEVVFLILVLLIAWLVILTFFIYQSLNRYRNFIKGTKNSNLVSVLEKIIQDQDQTKKKSEEIITQIEKLEKDGSLHFQKLGLVRFNPFSGTGGDQSFAIALLDQSGSGLVISSLHTRENTRIYAKPIDKGKPLVYDFSKEEKEAIVKALK